MEIYQFIAPAIAVYYLVRIFSNLKNSRNFLFTSIMWMTFWLLITFLSITPHELSTRLANMLGFKSNINTIIFIVLGFLIVLAYYLSSKTDKLETQVTNLVRQLALDERRIKELEAEKNDIKTTTKLRSKLKKTK